MLRKDLNILKKKKKVEETLRTKIGPYGDVKVRTLSADGIVVDIKFDENDLKWNYILSRVEYGKQLKEELANCTDPKTKKDIEDAIVANQNYIRNYLNDNQ